MSLQSRHLVILLLRLCFALVFLLQSCEYPEHTSVAEQIGETFETKVREHPKWSRNTSILHCPLEQISLDGELSGVEQSWKNISAMGFTTVVLSGVFDVKQFQDELINEGKFAGFSDNVQLQEVLRRQVNKAKSYSVKVLLELSLDAYSKRHPLVKALPEAFSSDTLRAEDDELVIWRTNHEDSAWKEMLVRDLKGLMSSTSIAGFSFRNVSKFDMQFWENIRSQLGEECFLVSDHDDPNAHHVAFDVTPLLWSDFIDGTAIETSDLNTGVDEQKRFVRNAYRSVPVMLPDTIDSVHYDAKEIQNRVLSYTWDGVPWVECGISKEILRSDTMLHFGLNERDSIYTILNSLKRNIPAAWNGMHGAQLRFRPSGDKDVLICSRQKDTSEVITVLNLSDRVSIIEIEDLADLEYRSILSSKRLSIYTNGELEIEPFGSEVFIRDESELDKLISGSDPS